MLGMPPPDAIAYLKKKGLRIGWNWHETLDAAHARSFTVAKVARIDVLRDIKRELQNALKNGVGQKEFFARLTPMLQKRGWWGKQIIVDGDGEAEVAQLGSPRRLRTIYQTNMQSAYMAGRFKTNMAARRTHPYWRYVALLDSKTRVAHRQLDGHVFSLDDAFTDVGYPPNGYNCRCRAQPLSRERVRRLGVEPTDTSDLLETRVVEAGVDKRTGEVRFAKQTGFRLPGKDGKPVWVGPDVGFNSSPAASHILDDVLVDHAKELVDNNAYAQAQRLLLSKPRLDAWRSFIRNTIEYGVQQRQTMTVGVMQAKELAYAAAKGAQISPVIFVRDNLIAGKKARRHRLHGDALSTNNWLNLPRGLVGAKVYWDTADNHLVYLLDDGSVLAVRSIDQTKSGIPEAATVFKKKPDVFEKDTREGKLVEIR